MSSSPLGIRFRLEPLKTLAFDGIDGTYSAVGTPLLNPARMLILKNLTDTELFASLDGITDQIHLASGEVIVLDITTNKSTGIGFFLAQGERVYVKDGGVAATVGAVYLTVIYASESAAV
jgi:hypothetical protein